MSWDAVRRSPKAFSNTVSWMHLLRRNLDTAKEIIEIVHCSFFLQDRILRNGSVEQGFSYSTKAMAKNLTGTLPLVKGFVATAIAVICFGSNFVPVKKIDTGDGELHALFDLGL